MFEPNLFDYSMHEFELPNGQGSGFLLRVNKKDGVKQYHHFQQGWQGITEEKFFKLSSLAKKHNVTDIVKEDDFADVLGYMNYNQYMAEHPEIEYNEYDTLSYDERAKWCYELFKDVSDTDEIARMVSDN